ncbi:MAG TPA: response regulator [Nitrospiria bacterium]|nr:response regulator [Nitrospiria bacterium]
MSQLSFLVVEDSPTMRQLVTFSLKRIRDAKIVEATDGVDALKKMAEEKFSLIIADINMPLMDGLKLLSIIRKEPAYSAIPVIIVTTEGAEVDKEKGLKLGANAYLTKPIQTAALLSKVKELLKVEIN